MNGRCVVSGATLHGVEAIPVNVEVKIGPGLPGISIVGMPDSTVQEARLRVKSAIRSVGLVVPPSNIVVNLAPSSVKKTGSGFDLPIALGILVCTGQVDPAVIENRTFVGELSLGGNVSGVQGLLAFAKMVQKEGGYLVTGNTSDDLSKVLPDRHEMVLSIGEFAGGENSSAGSQVVSVQERSADARPMRSSSTEDAAGIDFADIATQDFVKRALQIVAAGNHSILLVGSPGSGKTMLARRLPTIMPPLNEEEMLETAMVYSVSGLDFHDALEGHRPFRAPHHSATAAGMLGGGNPITPGEVSLSHNGVLFLDEMPEFSSRVLQSLRQPIEDENVVLVRADGVYRLPARFLLVGSANPCPCGYLGDPERECTCSASQVSRYQARIGGPLVDRFDMMVNVSRSDPKAVLQSGKGTSSAELYRGVLSAREFASHRRKRLGNEIRGSFLASDSVSQNPDLKNPGSCDPDSRVVRSGEYSRGREEELIAQCDMAEHAIAYIEEIARVHAMSGRGIMKVLRVARTIADMEGSERVTTYHISEASMFRMQDRG